MYQKTFSKVNVILTIQCSVHALNKTAQNGVVDSHSANQEILFISRNLEGDCLINKTGNASIT